MKSINILFQIILSILLLSFHLNAQFDAGTIIYSQTGSANSISVLNNNYEVVDFDGDSYVDVITVKSDATNDTNQLLWYKFFSTSHFVNF